MAKTVEEIREQIAALQAELQKQEEAEARAAQAGNAKRALSLVAAMRAAFKEMEDMFPGTFDPEKWAVAFTYQAWPRDAKYKKLADLSETEVHEAKQIGVKAISNLK